MHFKYLVFVTGLFFPMNSLFAQSEAGAGKTSATKTGNRFLSNSQVGAGLNIVNADQLGGTVIGFLAYGDYMLNEDLSLGLSADYWSESSGSLADNQVSVSDFSVGVNGKYRLEVKKYPKLTPYFGAGGALHRFVVKLSEKTDDNVLDPYEDTNQDVSGKLGADVMGGVNYSINDDIDLGGQVRYRNILDADVQLDQFVVDGSVQYKL